MTDIRHRATGRPAGALVDDEHESTDAAGSPSAEPWLAPATAPRLGRARRRPGGRLIVVGALLLAAVGFLLFEGIGTSLDYYVTVRQALAQRTTLAAKTFRLQGIVVPGTVSHHGTTVDFSVAQAGDRHLQIAVVNHGVPPQLFKVGIPVIVQGRFDGAAFVSNQLIVDHTGNYLPARDGPRSAGSASSAGSAGSGSSAGSAGSASSAGSAGSARSAGSAGSGSSAGSAGSGSGSSGATGSSGGAGPVAVGTAGPAAG